MLTTSSGKNWNFKDVVVRLCVGIQIGVGRRRLRRMENPLHDFPPAKFNSYAETYQNIPVERKSLAWVVSCPESAWDERKGVFQNSTEEYVA